MEDNKDNEEETIKEEFSLEKLTEEFEEEINEDIFSRNKVIASEKRKSSKLTKEEEKAVRDLRIVVPPKIKSLRTKVQLLEYWKAIFIATLTIVLYFFYFENPILNIWVLRIVEMLLIIGAILLTEKLYHSFVKIEFLLLIEVLIYTFSLLICSEMIGEHPVFNGGFLLILSFCYIIYYIIKGIISSRIIYVEYMRARSDVREILQDNRESYI